MFGRNEVMNKPTIKLSEWSFVAGIQQVRLAGVATDHPLFGKGSFTVTTSKIIRFDLEKRKAETINTVYLLEDAEKQNHD